MFKIKLKWINCWGQWSARENAGIFNVISAIFDQNFWLFRKTQNACFNFHSIDIYRPGEYGREKWKKKNGKTFLCKAKKMDFLRDYCELKSGWKKNLLNKSIRGKLRVFGKKLCVISFRSVLGKSLWKSKNLIG